jgi:hypothetical protein
MVSRQIGKPDIRTKRNVPGASLRWLLEFALTPQNGSRKWRPPKKSTRSIEGF